ELRDGTVIVAGHQSRGRGRLGREWLSPPGESLLFSVLLKPGIRPSDAALATPLMAAAIAEFLSGLGVEAKIRWPNDVTVGQAKIAGILAEASIAGGELGFIVASAGINVNQGRGKLSEVGRPATSVFVETGKRREPADLLEPIMGRFDRLYETFVKEGFAAVADAWRSRMSLAGEMIALDLGGRIVQGRVLAFGDDGSIELKESSGEVSRHLAGEVVKLLTKAEEEGI
ncbi:MAG TPA: biotin--[acetyl-CoA-carboxylase] ligase, partial [bacterium]|nr:biotin--[acetyl-CoA-carboxylase] ligase [bacterium]